MYLSHRPNSIHWKLAYEWILLGYDKVLTVFVKYISSELEYGLHDAKVATRWDPLSGGCTRSYYFFLNHARICAKNNKNALRLGR